MVRQAADRDKARSDFNLLREQMRDPLLTVLTIVLAFWMLVRLCPLEYLLHEGVAAKRDRAGRRQNSGRVK